MNKYYNLEDRIWSKSERAFKNLEIDYTDSSYWRDISSFWGNRKDSSRNEINCREFIIIANEVLSE